MSTVIQQNVEIPKTRKCTRCNVNLPISFFRVKRNLMPYKQCIDCINTRKEYLNKKSHLKTQ